MLRGILSRLGYCVAWDTLLRYPAVRDIMRHCRCTPACSGLASSVGEARLRASRDSTRGPCACVRVRKSVREHVRVRTVKRYPHAHAHATCSRGTGGATACNMSRGMTPCSATRGIHSATSCNTTGSVNLPRAAQASQLVPPLLAKHDVGAARPPGAARRVGVLKNFRFSPGTGPVLPQKTRLMPTGGKRLGRFTLHWLLQFGAVQCSAVCSLISSSSASLPLGSRLPRLHRDRLSPVIHLDWQDSTYVQTRSNLSGPV
jgi:hypothetical protein